MIADLLLGLVNASVGWMFGLIPEWSWEIPEGMLGIVGLMMNLDAFLPISELFVVLSLMMSAALALLAFKFGKMIVNLIRGSGA